MQNDNENDNFYQDTRGDTLLTLVSCSLTLLALALAGYYAPSLLTVALH